MAADRTPQEIIDAQQKLRGERFNWDNLYQEVADRCWPQMSDFLTVRSPGEKRSEKIFDSTATLALERGTAAFHSLMVPDSQYWHGLSMGADPELMEWHPVKVWLEELRNLLFAVRRKPSANFSGQAQEAIRSLLAFGSLCFLTEDDLGRGIRYKAMHLSEMDWTENASGFVDCAYRCFKLTAKQAVEEFGLENLPDKIRDCYDKGDGQSRFEFIHYVSPNRKRDARRLDYQGMAFYSCYVSIEGKQFVSEGGYRRFPYQIARYSTNPRETRGRGPAILMLPDIKMLNEMEKTTLRAGHMAVDPPLLMFDDGALQGFQMRPRALNFGGVSADGKPLVQPLDTGANLPWALEMTDAKRKLINEGFWLTLFQILVETPQMTATEALLRAQEKGQLLAPIAGRQQAEWLGPMIRREIDILSEAGLVPPPPEELLPFLPVEWDEDGASVDLAEALDIQYTSPLSRLIRSEDSVAILRTFEQLAPLAQVDPTVYEVFDTEALPRELATINGVPAKVLRSPKQMADLQEQKRQAAAMQNILAAAPVAASAAKDLSQAAATAANVPQAIPGLGV